MKILLGELYFFDPVIVIEGDEQVGLFCTRSTSNEETKPTFVNINLESRGYYIISTEMCYLVRIKDNELYFEKVDFEYGEGMFAKSPLNLLSYFKSKGIKCHYRDHGEYKGKSLISYMAVSCDAIISENGYLQRFKNDDITFNDCNDAVHYMYKTCVNYKSGQLTIDGKEVKRWGFKDDMWECDSMISWAKKSFRQKQQLSIDELKSLADQWRKDAMEKSKSRVSSVHVEFCDGSQF